MEKWEETFDGSKLQVAFVGVGTVGQAQEGTFQDLQHHRRYNGRGRNHHQVFKQADEAKQSAALVLEEEGERQEEQKQGNRTNASQSAV